jgi:hypothetical protein
MAVCLTAHSADRASQAAAGATGQPLPEFLAGTRWFWMGKKEDILEFRKDGTAQLVYWPVPTDWKVTGSNEVTFTMHKKDEDVTAIVTFTTDRSSFSGIQFDKKGAIAKSPRAPDRDPSEMSKPLREFLAGTRWFWMHSKDHILEFRKDGKAQLDYWTLPTDWKVTGPNEVTFTMHKKEGKVTSVVTFTEDRTSFSGIAFNKKSVIGKTPRAPGN